MTLLLITITAVLAAAVAWRRLEWGVLLVLLCLPSYGVRATVAGVPITLLEVLILVVSAVWLWRWRVQGRSALAPRSPFLWAAAAFALLATIELFVSPDLVRAAGIWKAYFVEAPLFFVAASGIVRTRQSFERAALALGVTALYISVFAIIQKLTNGWLVPYDYWYRGEGPRVTSFYSYPNAIGLFVGPIIALGFGYGTAALRQLVTGARTAPVVARLVFWLSVITCGLLAILFAHSDGALVGLAAAAVVFGLLTPRLRVATAGLLVAGGVAVAVWGLPSSVTDILLLRDWSGQVRRSVWSESVQLLQDHWLLGAGLAGYQTALVPYHHATYLEIFLYPHNIVLNFWSELGAAGVLAVLGLFGHGAVYGLRRLRRASPGERLLLAGALATLTTFAVHGLVDAPYFKNDLAVLWWLGWLFLAAPLEKDRPSG